MSLTLLAWSCESFQNSTVLIYHLSEVTILATNELCKYYRYEKEHTSGNRANVFPLTRWGRATHICVSNLIITGSDMGLLPGRRQAIIWTNARISSIGPLAINFSEILIKIQIISLKKMYLKLSSAKWRLLCLDLNMLTLISISVYQLASWSGEPPASQLK